MAVIDISQGIKSHLKPVTVVAMYDFKAYSNSPFQNCARGLGKPTLAMHHGTVLGDLTITRSLAQLWNSEYVAKVVHHV